MYIPISVQNENELEIQKKAIQDKKSMLLLNLTAKKQHLCSGVSFHPQMDKKSLGTKSRN